MIPEPVKNAFLAKTLVLFVGAGFGTRAKLPSSENLADALAEALERRGTSAQDVAGARQKGLVGIADLFASRVGELACKQLVVDLIEKAELGADRSTYELIHRLRAIDVITTNYDNLLKKTAPDPAMCRVISNASLLINRGPGINCYAYHGNVADPNSMVLTTADTLRSRGAPYERRILTMFTESVVLCLGYSGRDWDFLEKIYNSAGELPAEQRRHRGYLAIGSSADRDEVHEETLRSQGYELIREDAATVLAELVEFAEAQFLEWMPDLLELARKDPAIRALIDDPPELDDFLGPFGNDVPLRPQRVFETEAMQVLKEIRSGTFGSKQSVKLAPAELLAYVVGLISRHAAANKERGEFVSALKLHKICYFLGRYNLTLPLEFGYRRYPYGVWSPGLESRTKRMLEDHELLGGTTPSVHPKTQKLSFPSETFALLLPGEALFTRARTEIERQLVELRVPDAKEVMAKVDRLIIYLYGEKKGVLGYASKRDYIDVMWTEAMGDEFLRRFGLIIDEMGLGDQHKREIKERFAREFSFGVHPDLIQIAGALGPEGVIGELAKRTPTKIFDARRISWLSGSKVSTNYYVADERYRSDEMILEWAVSEFDKLIPAQTDLLVTMHGGLSLAAGVRLAECRPNLELVGPLYSYPGLQLRLDLAPWRGKRAVLLTNIGQTGWSLQSAVAALRKASLTVDLVLAFADRDCGAFQNLGSVDVGYQSLLTKKDLIDIVRSTNAV